MILEKRTALIRQDNKKVLLRNLFDMGDKYKVYEKGDRFRAVYYSPEFFGKSLEYHEGFPMR